MISSPTLILDYYGKHRVLIEENLLLSADPENPEAIHNLRLSIKRLRVLGKLVENLSQGAFKAKDSLHEINRLFKSAGRLRDIQVLKILVEGLPGNSPANISDFHSYLQRRENKQRVKFDHALASYNKDNPGNLEQELALALQDISDAAALQGGQILLSDLIHNIRELYHARNDEKRMHSIRTRLKEINYLNNIFNDAYRLEEQLHISPERLKEVGELAGAWHDCLNLESRLMRFFSKNAETNASSEREHIITELRQKKEGLLQEYVCILLNEMKI
jgi:CHAD domain-containing protein